MKSCKPVFIHHYKKLFNAKLWSLWLNFALFCLYRHCRKLGFSKPPSRFYVYRMRNFDRRNA